MLCVDPNHDIKFYNVLDPSIESMAMFNVLAIVVFNKCIQCCHLHDSYSGAAWGVDGSVPEGLHLHGNSDISGSYLPFNDWARTILL